MILESYISKEKGLLSNEEFHQIKYTISTIYELHNFSDEDIISIQNLLIHDKKNEYGKVQFALINGIGKIIINQSVENELIINSFKDYKS
jgi:3-dehydroquinate synthase